jgi:OTU domain-containing protein 6
LKQHEDEFGAFVEFTDSVSNYDQYVEQVRSSSEWGGHVELRALSVALRRPIIIYSAREKEPLVLQDTNHLDDTALPIRLSYHLHYYALGEHYNQVVDAKPME